MRLSMVRARAMKPSRNRSRSGATVSLEYIAVDEQGAISQQRQVYDTAERTANQALDFLGAPGLLAARRLSGSASAGCPREHSVLGGQPSLICVIQKRGYFILDTAGAEHASITNRDEHRSFGVLRVTEIEGDFSQSRWTAAVDSHHLAVSCKGVSSYHRDFAFFCGRFCF